MKYKLIAFDMDGTLLDKEGNVPPATVDAVHRAMDRGIQVTLATGRMFRSAARCAQQLGIHIPVISYQGSLVADPWNGSVLLHTPMSIPVAREAIAVALEAAAHLNLYIDDELYVTELTDGLKRYADRNFAQPHVVSDLASCMDKDPTKLMVWGDAQVIDKAHTLLTDRIGPRCLITRSYKTLCEVGHADTGKANALKFLCGMLGVQQSETVAVGDGPNDEDMLEWAGLGVVMDTAPDDVKTKADWVVTRSPQDGLAELIDRLMGPDGA
ncbi:MAG: HAD family phosphatase [Chloroflexi bacterium]|nr:HAD family phosphatase [Chloroflexota bacterium]